MSQDRNLSYGGPEENFGNITDYWNTYLRSIGVFTKESNVLACHDVANMMILTKIARMAKSPEKHDHWIDIAGYAACGAECVINQTIKSYEKTNQETTAS